MDGARVHFEVYVRKRPGASWTLEMATETRALAVSTAHDVIREGGAVSAKVTKETLDEATGEFRALTILNTGEKDTGKKPKPPEPDEPLCASPQDLYTCHARERIGRVLEGWLAHNQATPFELLHRADLIEHLEAAGVDLQHAVQKIAIPESHARQRTLHDMIRHFHALVEQAVERVMRDHARGVLPDLAREDFALCAARLAKHPEGAYLLGAAVARALAPAKTWSEKVELLIGLADQAPPPGAARTLAIATITQPLAEILGAKPGLGEILGRNGDLGGELAAMTRLAAATIIDNLVEMEPSVAKVMPTLSECAQRLSHWLATDDFMDVRAAIGRRILRELNGHRRLCPSDAAGEIVLLRGLAMALSAASGALLPIDDVQAAFSARSRMLVTGDFVEAYLGKDRTGVGEVEALLWLTENVIGEANKRQAGRWLRAVITTLRFETELRDTADDARARLGALAGLQRSAARCGLVVEDFGPIQAKLGEIGGLVEADARLVTQVLRAPAPALTRLAMLLKLASGDSAPLGPAADRARAAAMKLARDDSIRAELADSPEKMEAFRDLVQLAAKAA